MDKTLATQLSKHEASIKRLEKVIDVITRRLFKVEHENARLKSALNRTNNVVDTKQNKG